MRFKLYKRSVNSHETEGIIIEYREDGTCNVWDMWLPGSEEFNLEGGIQLEVLAENISLDDKNLYSKRYPDEPSRASIKKLFEHKHIKLEFLLESDTLDNLLQKLLSEQFELFL